MRGSAARAPTAHCCAPTAPLMRGGAGGRSAPPGIIRVKVISLRRKSIPDYESSNVNEMIFALNLSYYNLALDLLQIIWDTYQG